MSRQSARTRRLSTASSASENWSEVRKKLRIGAIIASDDSSEEENVQDGATSFDISDYINKAAAEKLNKFNQKQKARDKSDTPPKGRAAESETDEDRPEDMGVDDEPIYSTDDSSLEESDNENAEIDDNGKSKTKAAEPAKQRRWSLRSVLPRAKLPPELRQPLEPPPSKKRKQEKVIRGITEVPVNNGDGQGGLISSTPIQPSQVNEAIAISPVPGVPGESSNKLILTQRPPILRKAIRPGSPARAGRQLQPPESEESDQESVAGVMPEVPANNIDGQGHLISSTRIQPSQVNEAIAISPVPGVPGESSKQLTLTQRPQTMRKSTRSRSSAKAGRQLEPPESEESDHEREESDQESVAGVMQEVPANNIDGQGHLISSTPIQPSQVNEAIAISPVPGVPGESSKKLILTQRQQILRKAIRPGSPARTRRQLEPPESEGSEQESVTGVMQEIPANNIDGQGHLISSTAIQPSQVNEAIAISPVPGVPRESSKKLTLTQRSQTMRNATRSRSSARAGKQLEPPSATSKERDHESIAGVMQEVSANISGGQEGLISSTAIQLSQVNEAIAISPVPIVPRESSKKLTSTQRPQIMRKATRSRSSAKAGTQLEPPESEESDHESEESDQESVAGVMQEVPANNIDGQGHLISSTPIQPSQVNEAIAISPVRRVPRESSKKLTSTQRPQIMRKATRSRSSAKAEKQLEPPESEESDQESVAGVMQEVPANNIDGQGHLISSTPIQPSQVNEAIAISPVPGVPGESSKKLILTQRQQILRKTTRSRSPARAGKQLELPSAPSKERDHESIAGVMQEFPANFSGGQGGLISSTAIQPSQVNEAIAISPVPRVPSESSKKLTSTQRPQIMRKATRSRSSAKAGKQLEPPPAPSKERDHESIAGVMQEIPASNIDGQGHLISSTAIQPSQVNEAIASSPVPGVPRESSIKLTLTQRSQTMRKATRSSARAGKQLEPPRGPSKERDHESIAGVMQEVPANISGGQEGLISSTAIRPSQVNEAIAISPVPRVPRESSKKLTSTQRPQIMRKATRSRSSAKAGKQLEPPPAPSNERDHESIAGEMHEVPTNISSLPPLPSSQGSQRSTTGRRRSLFQMAREKTAKSKSKVLSKKSEKTPERYVGNDPFGNYHMMKQSDVRQILMEEKPDVRLDDGAMRNFTLKINHYLEDFFVHYCEKTEQPLGFIPFQSLLSALKSEGLLPPNADAEYLLKTMKKDLPREDWNRSEGILIPSRFSNTDDNSDYLFK